MAAKKKKSTQARKTSSRGAKVAKVAASQLNQLKITVRGLKNRLLQEARRRQVDAKVMAAARKARQAVNQQVAKLRAEGRKLAGDLKATLDKVKRHEDASRDAQSRVKALNSELKRKNQELARKTAEVERLSRELQERRTSASVSPSAAEPAADEPGRQGPLFPSEPSGWDPPSGGDSD
jgi:chromosome segregation ATPase